MKDIVTKIKMRQTRVDDLDADRYLKEVMGVVDDPVKNVNILYSVIFISGY